MLPDRYLYLVSVNTDEPIAIFSVDHLDHEREILKYEVCLRTEYHLDDVACGLVLKDSLLSPLADDILAHVRSASGITWLPHSEGMHKGAKLKLRPHSSPYRWSTLNIDLD